MHVHPRKLEKLKKRLQHIFNQQDLRAHREIIQQISGELSIDVTDCAAALLLINQPHLFQIQQPRVIPQNQTPPPALRLTFTHK